MPDLTLDSRVTIPELVVSRDLGGETVVLNLETGMYYDLDGVATDAWLAIKTMARLRDVHAHLLSMYDVESQVLSSDLLHLIDQMAAKGLIQVEG